MVEAKCPGRRDASATVLASARFIDGSIDTDCSWRCPDADTGHRWIRMFEFMPSTTSTLQLYNCRTSTSASRLQYWSARTRTPRSSFSALSNSTVISTGARVKYYQPQSSKV